MRKRPDRLCMVHTTWGHRPISKNANLMLKDTLVFLKNSLNTYLNSVSDHDGAQEDPVHFLSGQSVDQLEFKLNSVSILIVNLEEERVLNPPDIHQLRLPGGKTQKVQPEIRLNVYVLFVAHFKQYDDAMKNLSGVIRYFQNHRVFNHENSPDLDKRIGPLIVELKTLSFSEQNEIWGALRLPYHPSVLYRIKMVIFQDEIAEEIPGIKDVSVNVHNN